METYNYKNIEKKWQDRWEEAGIFHASNNSDKPKFFGLVEFPYPSGQGLHVGHPRSNGYYCEKAQNAGRECFVSHRLGRIWSAYRKLCYKK